MIKELYKWGCVLSAFGKCKHASIEILYNTKLFSSIVKSKMDIKKIGN